MLFLLLPLHSASSAVRALLVVSALLVSRCDAQPTDNEAVASFQRWPHPLDTLGVSFLSLFRVPFAPPQFDTPRLFREEGSS